jgi:hypothetical protein
MLDRPPVDTAEREAEAAAQAEADAQAARAIRTPAMEVQSGER